MAELLKSKQRSHMDRKTNRRKEAYKKARSPFISTSFCFCSLFIPRINTITYIKMFSKLALLSLASLVLADSETFSLLVIRSGSQFQNSGIKLTDNTFTASGAGTVFVSGVITDDGKFKLEDGSYAVIGTDDITTGTEGSSPFSITDGYFSYDGSSGFAISDDGIVSAGSGYALSARSSSGARAADFSPSDSSSSASNSTSSSSTAEFITQTDNGANALRGVGFGAAVAAGAALLI
jgi:hypothetical protein